MCYYLRTYDLRKLLTCNTILFCRVWQVALEGRHLGLFETYARYSYRGSSCCRLLLFTIDTRILQSEDIFLRRCENYVRLSDQGSHCIFFLLFLRSEKGIPTTFTEFKKISLEICNLSEIFRPTKHMSDCQTNGQPAFVSLYLPK